MTVNYLMAQLSAKHHTNVRIIRMKTILFHFNPIEAYKVAATHSKFFELFLKQFFQVELIMRILLIFMDRFKALVR